MTEDRIVREAERRSITGLCRTSAYVLERKGEFPQRVVLTGNSCGWRLSELLEWVRTRPKRGSSDSGPEAA